MDPPPPYEAAASSSAGPSHPVRNGIPVQSRRSMEDEQRSLPRGWIRQYDAASSHQFFVDTRQDPPRSIWHHPYDDEEYVNSLPASERDNINRLHKSVSLKDIEAESSDDDSIKDVKTPRKGAAGAVDPNTPTGLHKYGRKIKDRLTHSTHQEREADRHKRAQEEQEAYRAHLQARQAFSRAMETGQPQFLCKDRQGRDVFIEPPGGPMVPRGAMGYNPYAQGPYANPSARFVRPQQPYARPYGYGYGGGFGFPLVGGLLAGSLIGGALF